MLTDTQYQAFFFHGILISNSRTAGDSFVLTFVGWRLSANVQRCALMPTSLQILEYLVAPLGNSLDGRWEEFGGNGEGLPLLKSVPPCTCHWTWLPMVAPKK